MSALSRTMASSWSLATAILSAISRSASVRSFWICSAMALIWRASRTARSTEFV